jgi:anti-sigma regulatory factor (Ser/Thr protein kinase)
VTATSDDEAIRLTVPAQPDFVQVVRVAVRVVSGRAGCSDDARSRLQAAVGAAFFEVVDRAGDGHVRATLTDEDGRLVVAISGEPPSAALDPTSVAGLADGHELADDGRSLVIWVAT